MIDGKRQDRLDEVLTDYFRPVSPPPGLARRVVDMAAQDREGLLKLERGLGIEATPRGVALIRAGLVEKPATAAARRLAEQARQELVEYLSGQRAFFSVPVELSTAPEFQRRVLEAARKIPFGESRLPFSMLSKEQTAILDAAYRTATEEGLA